MALLKAGGERGSNPLARRAQQYEDLLKARGKCKEQWKAQDRTELEHLIHRCERYDRHGANHRCACGVTRKTHWKLGRNQA